MKGWLTNKKLWVKKKEKTKGLPLKSLPLNFVGTIVVSFLKMIIDLLLSDNSPPLN